jgi:hypothetical protein
MAIINNKIRILMLNKRFNYPDEMDLLVRFWCGAVGISASRWILVLSVKAQVLKYRQKCLVIYHQFRCT